MSGPGGSLPEISERTPSISLRSSPVWNCRELAAELTTFVPGRRVDDNVQIMLRFAEETRGLLWASQVTSGNQNNLRLRVFGEKAGLEWKQEEPNYLWFAELGKTPKTIYRAGPGATPVAAHASRVPSGHPEGFWKHSRNSTLIWLSRSVPELTVESLIPRRCWCLPLRMA